MKWGDITQDNGRWILSVIMNKSEKPVHIPLGLQAIRWIPGCEEYGNHDANSLVFEHLPGDSHINDQLKIWAADARITKSVTYHTSRHTFAVLALAAGGDIYTVGKLLGHTSINSTQVYADVIMETKIDAINHISISFPVNGSILYGKQAHRLTLPATVHPAAYTSVQHCKSILCHSRPLEKSDKKHEAVSNKL